MLQSPPFGSKIAIVNGDGRFELRLGDTRGAKKTNGGIADAVRVEILACNSRLLSSCARSASNGQWRDTIILLCVVHVVLLVIACIPCRLLL
jgi:hypothetical protein